MGENLVPYAVSFLSNLTYIFLTGYTLGHLFALTLFGQWTMRILSDPSDNIWAVREREEPPILRDPALGTHGFVQAGGVKLHYVENGDRSKPLMLLIHGYPEFWYSWRHQLKEFSSDYWVVAMDMRGFGKSEKPERIDHYKAEILAQDIKNFVTALGRKKFILVGHDWGGIISFYFLYRNPQMVYSYMILNSAHPYVLLQGLRSSLPQIKRSWYMFFYQLPKIPELRATADDMLYLNTTLVSSHTPSTITIEDLEAFKYNWGKNKFTTGLNIYRANLYFETSHTLLGLRDSPDFPHGLLLFGDKDKVLDLVQNETAKMAANLRYVTVDGNHFVQQDNPNATNAAMREFLKSCPGCDGKSDSRDDLDLVVL